MKLVSNSVLVLLMSTIFAQGAYANLISNGSFEDVEGLDRNWEVFQELDDNDPNTPNWESLAGTGIEIQTSGTVVEAQDGNNYIELDSDPRRGGLDGAGTNSMMGQTVEVDTAGEYALNFFYQGRTNRSGDDNMIYASIWEHTGGDTFDSLVEGIQVNALRRDGSWENYGFTADLTEGLYQVRFQAEGRENTLGGFIDNVRLTNTAPLNTSASALLLFAVPAMALRRLRRK